MNELIIDVMTAVLLLAAAVLVPLVIYLWIAP